MYIIYVETPILVSCKRRKLYDKCKRIFFFFKSHHIYDITHAINKRSEHILIQSFIYVLTLPHEHKYSVVRRRIIIPPKRLYSHYLTSVRGGAGHLRNCCARRVFRGDFIRETSQLQYDDRVSGAWATRAMTNDFKLRFAKRTRIYIITRAQAAAVV